MRNFIGRKDYLLKLEKLWKENKTKLVSVYGRRRVGKTELLKVFSKNKRTFFFEALEGVETSIQIKHFLAQLSEMFQEPYLRDLDYRDWPPVFELLSQKIEQEKNILIIFDEFPWMASGRTKLVSYVKFFWDKKWKYHSHLLLILCGSIASWMVKNVVRSTALYGRMSENVLVEPLQPSEVAIFIGNKRGQKEILEYLLCFGGIPRYLEEFNFNQSIQLNIENTCFEKSGFFVVEADKIFYSQFREVNLYKQIVKHLLLRPLILKDISQKLKVPSGGGLKTYLDNLSLAGIVGKMSQIENFKVAKVPHYYLADEFLRFHATFILPHQDEIEHTSFKKNFAKFTHHRWHPFLGYAFERFCLKHRYTIAEVLGFSQKVLGCGSMLNHQRGGYQYDLLYLRSDATITLVEVKYVLEPLSTSIIREMESKIQKTSFPRGITLEKVLICNQVPTLSLEESGYFHHILTAKDLFF